MPEAKVLYAVTAAVVSGLVVWVLVVLKTAKEPWTRARAATASAGLGEASPPSDVEPSPVSEEAASDEPAKSDG